MKKLVFIEENPLFNRWDIIDRIINIFYINKLFDKIIIIIGKRDNIYSIIVDKQYRRELVGGNVIDILSKTMNTCNRVCILDEQSPLDTKCLIESQCYFAGLHNDPSIKTIKYIEENFEYCRSRLSNISYLASTIIPIIEYIHESTTHYLYPRMY